MPRVALVFTAAAAVWATAMALPQHVAAADPSVRLELRAEPAEDGLWVFRAELSRGGKIESGEPVEFFQIAEFFGSRLIPLGTAVTDAAGVASLVYSPTSNGTQQIVARHPAPDGRYESGPVEIEVVGAVPAIPIEDDVLPIVRMWALPVGAAVLFLVWLTLAGILLWTVVGIARSGSGSRKPVTPAPPDSGQAVPPPSS